MHQFITLVLSANVLSANHVLAMGQCEENIKKKICSRPLKAHGLK